MGIFYMGTVFELNHEKYMLADCFDPKFEFQIVCISGYHAGNILGYIKKDSLLSNTHQAVTKDHLLKEINRNFLDIQELNILSNQ